MSLKFWKFSKYFVRSFGLTFRIAHSLPVLLCFHCCPHSLEFLIQVQESSLGRIVRIYKIADVDELLVSDDRHVVSDAFGM